MDLNELIGQLIRVRDGGGALEVDYHEGGRRRVIVRGQNADEFVWVEGELESVEDAGALPDVALVCRVTLEQEDEVFTRVDEASAGIGALEALADTVALRAVEPEYNDDFDPLPAGWLEEDSASVPASRVLPFERTAPWQAPTEAQLASPEFEALWQAIKQWDIGVPGAYTGYTGAQGEHVVTILKALARAGTLTEWGNIKERWR